MNESMEKRMHGWLSKLMNGWEWWWMNNWKMDKYTDGKMAGWVR